MRYDVLGVFKDQEGLARTEKCGERGNMEEALKLKEEQCGSGKYEKVWIAQKEPNVQKVIRKRVLLIKWAAAKP